MYSLRQNVIRAVRVLPEAVRVGSDENNEAELAREANEENSEREAQEKHDNELAESQDKISLLQSQIGLLNNRLKEAAVGYDGLAERCQQMEYQLANRETELQAEMQKKLEAEKNKFVDEGKAEAAKIIAEAEKIRAEASEKGHAEGFEKGKSDGLGNAISETQQEYLEKFSTLLAVLEKAQGEVEANLESIVQLNEARLVRLWQGTLTAMLNREVEIDPDTTRRVLEGLLSRVSDKNRLLIYLSPSEIDQIQNSTDKMTDLLRGVKHLEFLADPRVDRGSCIVETNLGIYDARWRTQMSQIEGQIADLYREVAKEVETTEQKKPKKTRAKKNDQPA